MEITLLHTIWFVLWALIWAIYFMLDGFDLGVGILHPFVAKEETQRRISIHTIAPIWDGNEVWLVTAGGVTFAAFPSVYATLFSSLYIPFLFVLFALIIRAVAIEFRNKKGSVKWRNFWDWAFFVGSFLASFLFGLIFGNIFQGLPFDKSGYHGNLLNLFNPYAIVVALTFVILFAIHGALWLYIKTQDRLCAQAKTTASILWPIGFCILFGVIIISRFYTNFYVRFSAAPTGYVLLAVGIITFIMSFVLIGRHPVGAFYNSCIAIACIILTGFYGLYPALLPSSIASEYSLTVINASASDYTLKIMTVVIIIFVPIVIAYQVWVYKIFRGPVTSKDVAEEELVY